MRRLAIVGAGQSGAQLAVGLQQRGYDVTLVSERSAEDVLGGQVQSSQCMFDSALQTERALGLDHWDGIAPAIEGIALSIAGEDATGPAWRGRLDAPALSVDYRVKLPRWMRDFERAGGDLRVRSATPADLEELARGHDLVIVATGKGELGRIFPRDRQRSPYDRPRRALALTYVSGMAPTDGPPVVSYNLAAGLGEYFAFPALGPQGDCDIMVFEGVPGGPLDCWDDVRTPAEHLERSLEVLRKHFPREAARCTAVELTDAGGVLRGRITPTVRTPVATLPSGRQVLGLADAVILNDPITGQGSNNAAKAASFYLDSILARGDRPFDERWMRQTFEAFWRGWAQWVVGWTNAMLAPPETHQRRLLDEAARLPALADTIANGFDDPRTIYQAWFDAQETDRLIAQTAAADEARFDGRDLRKALGQYATGVTVITARAPDGRRIGVTANSFTSVSLDPPMVLWCPSRSAPSLADLTEATHFAVNVLAADQHHLSRQFATPAQDKFVGVGCTEGLNGLPLIEGAVARFECRTVRFIDAGDHLICLGEVERYQAPGGPPLVFHSGIYHLATRHPEV